MTNVGHQRVRVLRSGTSVGSDAAVFLEALLASFQFSNAAGITVMPAALLAAGTDYLSAIFLNRYAWPRQWERGCCCLLPHHNL